MNAAHLRLENLRQLNGLTQAELAPILGVKQAQYSQIEKGTRNLTPEHRERLCLYFGISPRFFSEVPVDYATTPLNYRRRALTAKQAKMVDTAFGLTAQMVHQPGEVNYLTPPVSHPNCEQRSLDIIESIAAETRQEIRVPADTVIHNVTRCMNRLGITVTGLHHPLLPMDKLDGVSSPTITDAPFVAALNYNVTGDRFRFSAAHELGHIMMHTIDHSGSLTAREAEADTFAGAFLLPRQAMLRELSPHLTLLGYGQLKARWGVSIQALIRRAQTLGVIDDGKYRSLMIQVSSRGWRKAEPVHVPVEKPLTPAPSLPFIQPTSWGAVEADNATTPMAAVIPLFS